MRDHNSTTSRIKNIWPLTVFVVGLVLFLVGFRPTAIWFQSLMIRMVSPVWSSIQGDDENSVQSLSLLPKKELMHRLIQLEKRVTEEQILLDKATVIESEYNELLNLVGLDNANLSSLIARVVHTKSSYSRDTMIIDKGSLDNVIVGQGAVSESGILIGKVSLVDSRYSVISLISHADMDTPVMFISSDEEQEPIALMMRGKGGYQMQLEIPRHVAVEQGDVVSYANAPFVAGVIEKVSFDSRDPFQKTYVRLPVHPEKIRFVRLLDLTYEEIMPNDEPIILEE